MESFTLFPGYTFCRVGIFGTCLSRSKIADLGMVWHLEGGGGFRAPRATKRTVVCPRPQILGFLEAPFSLPFLQSP